MTTRPSGGRRCFTKGAISVFMIVTLRYLLSWAFMASIIAAGVTIRVDL
jgi:hypothetical protein